MRKIILIILILLSSIQILNAQAYSGTYSIGANGYFTTVVEAIDSLKAKGINGSIILNIQPGTYNGAVIITNISGSSSSNTITLQSANGDSTSVIITTTPIGSSLVVSLSIYNINYISIKNLTISHNNSQANGSIALSGMYNCNYISYKNCIFEDGSSSSFAQGSLFINDCNNITINNCKFEGWYDYGIKLDYYSNYNTNITIKNNIFNGHQNSNNNVEDIRAYIKSNVIIQGNTLRNRCWLSSSYINARINNNIFNGTFRMGVFQMGTNDSVVVCNNFISNKINSTSNTVKLKANKLNFYNNTISDSSAFNTAVFSIESSSNCKIKNNIFHDRGYGYLFYYDSGNSNIVSDHNDYYTPGYYGKTYNGGNPVSTLAAWKTLSGMEANSISVNPQFYSVDDLHIGNVALDNSGIPLSAVTDDIDGDIRPATPDMGADEANFYNIDAAAIGIRYDTIYSNTTCGDIIDSVYITIKNRGLQTIDFSQNNMQLQLNISGAATASYTATINSDSLLKDSTAEFLITPICNTNTTGQYSLSVSAIITADSNSSNNQLTENLTNYKINSFPYHQDFEGFDKYTSTTVSSLKEGWSCSTMFSTYNYKQNYTFVCRKGGYALGPSSDHTLMNNNGHWISAFYYSTSQAGSTFMYSPCIDFTGIQNPVFSFYYHMFGSSLSNDTLYVDVYNGSSWDTALFTIGGQQQAASGAPWLQANINLSAYSNSVIRIRFRTKIIPAANTIAIDDISIDAMPIVDLGPDTAICFGDQATMGRNYISGYTYEWRKLGQPTVLATTSLYTTGIAASYVYKATNTTGISNTDTISLSIMPLPTPSLGDDTIICEQQTISLSTINTYLSYYWQDSTTNSTLTVDSVMGSGQYWIMVEDNNHCYGFDTVSVGFKYCPGINQAAQLSGISIYPNPAKGYLYIESEEIINNATIKIYDIQSRELLSHQLSLFKNNRQRIDIGILSKGVYFVELRSEQAVMVTKLIVN